MLRMQRAVANFSMLKDTHWLFRLDRITTAAGRVADRHQHPGPGIRCLVEGTFNVHQACESYRDLAPGDPWWEEGPHIENDGRCYYVHAIGCLQSHLGSAIRIHPDWYLVAGPD